MLLHCRDGHEDSSYVLRCVIGLSILNVNCKNAW